MDYFKILSKNNIKNADKLAQELNEQLPKFGITDQENILFFLSNCANESGGFSNYQESLFYTTTLRLKQVFPSAFDPVRFPKTAIYNPNDYISSKEKNINNSVKLANLVYDDRIFHKGLGNIFDGDGAKFIGRSAIQITGRTNYQTAKDLSGIDFINHPELMADPQYALIGAMSWWKKNNVTSKKTLLATRQVVAGNYTNNPFGLAEVQNWYNKLKGAM